MHRSKSVGLLTILGARSCTLALVSCVIVVFLRSRRIRRAKERIHGGYSYSLPSAKIKIEMKQGRAYMSSTGTSTHVQSFTKLQALDVFQRSTFKFSVQIVQRSVAIGRSFLVNAPRHFAESNLCEILMTLVVEGSVLRSRAHSIGSILALACWKADHHNSFDERKDQLSFPGRLRFRCVIEIASEFV
jgi:hypothetical protein